MTFCIANCYAKCVVHSGRQSIAFVSAGIKVHIDNFSFYRIVIACFVDLIFVDFFFCFKGLFVFFINFMAQKKRRV